MRRRVGLKQSRLNSALELFEQLFGVETEALAPLAKLAAWVGRAASYAVRPKGERAALYEVFADLGRGNRATLFQQHSHCVMRCLVEVEDIPETGGRPRLSWSV